LLIIPHVSTYTYFRSYPFIISSNSSSFFLSMIVCSLWEYCFISWHTSHHLYIFLTYFSRNSRCL
jgi:hypothetical protein